MGICSNPPHDQGGLVSRSVCKQGHGLPMRCCWPGLTRQAGDRATVARPPRRCGGRDRGRLNLSEGAIAQLQYLFERAPVQIGDAIKYCMVQAKAIRVSILLIATAVHEQRRRSSAMSRRTQSETVEQGFPEAGEALEARN